MTGLNRAVTATVRVVSSIGFAAFLAMCTLLAGAALSVDLREDGHPVLSAVASGTGMALGGGNLGWAVRRRQRRAQRTHSGE
ncbi:MULTISPECIES: hypothetical protein [unclassified Curtobacterium]|uniref:hypothetical protein n=1 Tax=unclassified Curtobacterium TaxID=257496 RepID=UPI000D8FCB5B|nr:MULTISPECIES: hypothetical protein [unclassified Curtobacterium]PYY31928.1 hypothetical protein DEI89_14780 [Curtobacterium sp. MCBD17_030]PZE34467.1 hypothetical protein DEJ31_14555 [Curtobacterium sp. MCPF17_031]